MLDGVFLINEVMYFARRRKKDCMLFKVDFEKAYDYVSWNYLRYILHRTGFGSKWLN